MYLSGCRMLHRAASMVRPTTPSCALRRSDADGRVQEQEQLQRRALVAGAAGRGRLVNFL